MKLLLLVSVLLHLFSHFVYSKVLPIKCHFDYEGLCIKTVTRLLDESTVEGRQEFTIYYNDTKAEIVADCGLTNCSYSCRGSKGFVCHKQPSTNFTIVVNHTLRCITAGEFIFFEADKSLFSCKIPASENTCDHGLAIGLEIGAWLLLIFTGIGIGYLKRMALKTRLAAMMETLTSWISKHWRTKHECVRALEDAFVHALVDAFVHALENAFVRAFVRTFVRSCMHACLRVLLKALRKPMVGQVTCEV